MIPLSIPHLAGNEWQYVKHCLDTGWVSTAGAYVTQFEENIAAINGSKRAVSCMNGTAALHVCLKTLGAQPGDYVIAPNITFVATLNAITYTGAETILIDTDPDSWQMDLDLLERFLGARTQVQGGELRSKADGRRIIACMPVHVLGNMCDMERLTALCARYHLPIVEDSTEALGSTFNGKHAGTFGTFGTSSFNGNKIITTGGGGMVFTQNDELADRVKHLTTTAKTDPMDYFHDEVGYNYRLVNVLAAIGVAQLEQLPGILQKKKAMDAFYRENLSGVGDIQFQTVTPGVDHNCWLFTFRTERMRELLTYLNANGVQSRPFWTPMNQLPMYKGYQYVTEHDYSTDVHRTAISIPSSSGLTEEQLAEVVKQIRNFYG
ncbi:LegC family aminotransferase [Neolewinella antarctica]|uniref:Aminotransferase in exopolysaccharide biosynthesis n=1 Tax=Neolewinella antarctica TaxID=442734 RepID=A0ABX0XBH9_9BACT|nr:LegC family aminotransferase [Neolewinella antarctica]NJC26132.1 aminotransferase in exopolysaccharide biosynthesis [Neolewinella antarctica]